MAIILELQYCKKLGLPEYSSHNFSVSLKTEAASLDQIPRQAVDPQITNRSRIPCSAAERTIPGVPMG